MAIVSVDPFDFQAPFPLDLRRIKQNINGRNAIPSNARYIGMLCYTIDEATDWRLVGGTTDSDWIASGSSSGGIQAVVVNTGSPTGGNDGDIWFRPVSEGTDVYQKVNGSWANVGTLPNTNIAPTINNSLTLSETSSTLNGLYPDAGAGFTVISETNGIKYIKIDSSQWEQIGVVIV